MIYGNYTIKTYKSENLIKNKGLLTKKRNSRAPIMQPNKEKIQLKNLTKLFHNEQ